YYAFISNPITNSKGENTSAIFGFVRTLEEVLKKESPEYMAVAFDLGSDTFRKENYEDYKAQREASPEDITKSVPIIKEILKSYNIPIIGLKGFEADDVIGTLAKKASREGIEVYMMTSDKDYVQLVDEHIFLYKVGSKSKGNEKWGIEEVKEKYGISSPKQMIDLLGLMGDSADNIPGCPGIGEKTAQKLLQEYTSIENLLLHKEEIKPSIQRKLIENEEQIRSSQFLATIRCDAPIDFNPRVV
ncbi:MAG TPA: DNA polymerase I, partial [Porphyromonadaceae bacterium]|nr:DNA polymerase I [Porphyromonadaceae bacterium]